MIQPDTLLQNRYRVVQQVGKGGMGEVYLAIDERFQSRVAIKRTFFGDSEMSKAFKREARLLNHLHHEALPKVSDHFSEGDGEFLVMEFIEGFDFAELLERGKGPFPASDVLRWADELLDALDYLHTHKPPVVHRDIKPPNIKLTPRGKVMLLDFGLAKGAPTHTTTDMASSVFGYSLNFAPLEQMQGTGTDPRSDLYALAATLYLLLTGVRPPDALTRASASVKGQPDPLRPAHTVQAQVPAAVGQILHRAMSQNAALRYASAAAFRAALRLAGKSVVQLDARPQATVAALPQSITSPEGVAPVESSTPSQKSSRPAQTSSGVAPQESPQPASLMPTLRTVSRPGGSPVHSTDSHRHERVADTITDTTRIAHARKGAANRTFSIAACILVISVVAAAYLLTRSPGSHASGAAPNTVMQRPVTADEKIVPAEQPSHAALNTPPDSSPDAPVSNTAEPSASARSVDPNQSSNSRSVTDASKASDQTAPSTKESSATSNTASEAATSSGKPGLVIQNPTPASSATDASRRAEEARREQAASQPEVTNQPPPSPVYPPPPPPGNWPPPPPDGRRPPPPRP